MVGEMAFRKVHRVKTQQTDPQTHDAALLCTLAPAGPQTCAHIVAVAVAAARRQRPAPQASLPESAPRAHARGAPAAESTRATRETSSRPAPRSPSWTARRRSSPSHRQRGRSGWSPAAKPLGWRVAEIGSTRCARLRRDESEDERTNTETSCATELRDGLNEPLG